MEDTEHEGSMRPTERSRSVRAEHESEGVEEDGTGSEDDGGVEGRGEKTAKTATPQREEGEEREQTTATQQSTIGPRKEEMACSAQAVIAGYTKVTVLTIPVQYTAGRNNRKGGAVRSFLRAMSKNPRTHKFVRRLRKRYSKVGIRKSLQSYRREQNTRGHAIQ